MPPPLAPPSPQLDAMMNPPEEEAPASRSSRRSFRARVSDTIQRARGRSLSPAPPEREEAEAPANPSKGLRVSRLLRRSFDIARAASPGPVSRNQDVVYSYNAPTFQVPDLPDWQLYDGTSVSQDLDKLLGKKETLAPPPAPAAPMLPLQPAQVAAHMHFQPGQYIQSPVLSLNGPTDSSPAMPPSVQADPAPYQEPMHAPADEAPWTMPPGEEPLFGQTRQRSRTARESLGTLPASSFNRPYNPVSAPPMEDARAEADIVDAYADEAPLPALPADETADDTVIEHASEGLPADAPSASEAAPAAEAPSATEEGPAPDTASTWRTYDSDDEEMDENGAGRLYRQRSAAESSRPSSVQSRATEAKQQRILSAMQKAPEGAGLNDLMNRVVHPERQSWFQGLWSRKSSRSSGGSRAASHSASEGGGVVFRGANASPSIYSNDTMERFSDRGSIIEAETQDPLPPASSETAPTETAPTETAPTETAPTETAPTEPYTPVPSHAEALPESAQTSEPAHPASAPAEAPWTGWEQHPDAQWHTTYEQSWQDPNAAYYEGYDAHAAWYHQDSWHDHQAWDPNAGWSAPTESHEHMPGQHLSVQSSHIADVSYHGAHAWEAPTQGWHHPNWRPAEWESHPRPHQVRRKAPPSSQPPPAPATAPVHSSAPAPAPAPAPAVAPILPALDEEDETVINEHGQRLRPDGFGGLVVQDDTPPRPASVASAPSPSTPKPPPAMLLPESRPPPRPSSCAHEQGRPEASRVRSPMLAATPPPARDAPFQVAPEVYTTPQGMQGARGRMTWTPEMAEAAAKYIQSMTASASQSMLHEPEAGTSFSAIPGAPEPLPPPKPVPTLPASSSVVEQLQSQGVRIVLDAGDGVDLASLPLQQALKEMMARFYFYERHSVPLLRELDKRLVALEQWSQLPEEAECPAWNRDAVARMTSEVRREVRTLMHGTKLLHECRQQIQELANQSPLPKKRKRPVSAVLPEKRHVSSTLSQTSSRVCSGESEASQKTTVEHEPREPLAAIRALSRSPMARGGPRPCPPSPARSHHASLNTDARESEAEAESEAKAEAKAEAEADMEAKDEAQAEAQQVHTAEEEANESVPVTSVTDADATVTHEDPAETLAPPAEAPIQSEAPAPPRAPSPPKAVPVQRARSLLLASLQRADERTRTPPPPEPSEEAAEQVVRAPLASVGNTTAPSGGLRARAQKYLHQVEQSELPSSTAPENTEPKRSTSFQPSALSESLRRRMSKLAPAAP
ncbi:hypothetical protein MNAN1_003802 [Malassezia nana]|uniref:Uncharacterized protein n=1 Tax=Malassezia nana TaxID=180528 RepID=A0AAF0EUP3_9BASI|nr:hypothetical protein MNAN1_003802 [Malassezia nana]